MVADAAGVLVGRFVALLARVFPRDRQDDVASSHAGNSRRHILVGLKNHTAVFVLVIAYDGTDARILPCSQRLQVAGVFGWNVLRVGVQSAQQVLNGVGYQLLGVKCINIILVESAVYSVEQINILAYFVRVAFLTVCGQADKI